MKFLIRLEIAKNGLNWIKTFDRFVIDVKRNWIYVIVVYEVPRNFVTLSCPSEFYFLLKLQYI